MKKKLIFISAILSSLLLTSFIKTDLFPLDERIPEPDAIVHEIMDETFAILEKRYNIHPCGTGMNGKFEYLELSFQMCDNISQGKVREILFDCSQEFLKRINANEKIQSYLKPYPFEQKNIGIVFFIRDEDNQDVFDPKICCAAIERGVFEYRTKTKENRFQYKETRKETFEQALSKIAQSQNTAPLKETQTR